MKPESFSQACALVLLAWVLAGCNDQADPGVSRAAEPAPMGALPDLDGAAIGPQPGPDRTLAETDNPFANDRSAIAEGRRLFVWYNCYGCHGGRAGGGMGPSLRDVLWLYGDKPEDIFNSIAEGRSSGMPAWGTKLPEEQIWKLTAYITSMDTPAEPDAPPTNPVYPNPPPRWDVPDAKAGGGR